ncbi:MAG TPA: HAD-IA family hydrolase [Candidatus Woesebacteria bacterium]|nr:HAD-IA family hydrolase [Candidatus Woesebacteria bacterium]
MSDIKFVYFDLGSVVLKWKDNLRKLAEYTNTDIEKLTEIYMKYDNQSYSGEITFYEMWELMKGDLNFIDEDNLDICKLWIESFSPIEETHLLINELSEHNIPMGILSNIHSGIYEKTLGDIIPDVKYEAVVLSCDVKLVKPAKEIFEVATKMSKFKEEEILFVDDYLPNILSAKEYGWEGILFDENLPRKSINKVRKTLKLV